MANAITSYHQHDPGCNGFTDGATTADTRPIGCDIHIDEAELTLVACEEYGEKRFWAVNGAGIKTLLRTTSPITDGHHWFKGSSLYPTQLVEVFTYDPPSESSAALPFESNDAATLQSTISRLMGEQLRLMRELSDAKADIKRLRELITVKDDIIAGYVRTIASANSILSASGRAMMQDVSADPATALLQATEASKAARASVAQAISESATEIPGGQEE